MGIARYFRAYFYLERVKRFGNVPWIGKPLDIDDEALMAGRDSRELVMDSVLLLGSWSVLAHGWMGCVIVLLRSVRGGAPVSAGLRFTVGWRRQLERGGKAGSGFSPGRAGRVSALGALP